MVDQMTQQDYTAPEWPVKLSRKERFRQAFDVYQADGTTPDDSLAGWLFFGELFDRTGQKVLTLVNDGGISRPAPNAVLVELTTAQMSTLKPGPYRLEIYGTSAGERENLVDIIIQAE